VDKKVGKKRENVRKQLNLENVGIGTTLWITVDKKEGKKRERENVRKQLESGKCGDRHYGYRHYGNKELNRHIYITLAASWH